MKFIHSDKRNSFHEKKYFITLQNGQRKRIYRLVTIIRICRVHKDDKKTIYCR